METTKGDVVMSSDVGAATSTSSLSTAAEPMTAVSSLATAAASLSQEAAATTRENGAAPMAEDSKSTADDSKFIGQKRKQRGGYQGSAAKAPRWLKDETKTRTADPARRGKRAEGKKRKMALLVGYNGAGYNGLQMQMAKGKVNTTAKTIEYDIATALYKAGGISDSNHLQLQKVKWSRAARTDKGVHAAANMIALKLVNPGTVEEMVAKVNSFLPSQVRVLGACEVTKSFSAKQQCTSRRYEYVIPSYAFQHWTEYKAWFDQERKTSAALQVAVSSLKEDSDIVMQDAPAAPSAAAGASAGAADTSTDAAAGVSPAVKTWECKNHVCNDINIAYLQPRHFRLAPERFEYLNKLLANYHGTKNHHNFTVGKKPIDKSAIRYIMSFKATELFEVDGMQFVRLEVHGAAFLLYQIRRLVGLICAIMRGVVEDSVFERVFAHARLRIPTVPGFGLLLNQCIFQGYDLRMTEQFSGQGRRTLESLFQDCVPAIKAFKESSIYPMITAEEAERHTFLKWLQRCLDEPNFWGEPVGQHQAADPKLDVESDDGAGDDD